MVNVPISEKTLRHLFRHIYFYNRVLHTIEKIVHYIYFVNIIYRYKLFSEKKKQKVPAVSHWMSSTNDDNFRSQWNIALFSNKLWTFFKKSLAKLNLKVKLVQLRRAKNPAQIEKDSSQERLNRFVGNLWFGEKAIKKQLMCNYKYQLRARLI